MKILIDIPEEFEIDYRADRFADFFDRVKADMNFICGKYESETADILKSAFDESKLYDPDKVVDVLKKEFKKYYDDNWDKAPFMVKVVNIVKDGGINE